MNINFKWIDTNIFNELEVPKQCTTCGLIMHQIRINFFSSIFRGPSLAKLKVNFPTLYDTLQLNDNSIWSAFSRGQMSEEEEVPVQLAKRMTPFQKV